MAEKLDIYSDLRVPFDVATWCRGHKFNVAAVGISRELKTLNELRETRERLEMQEAAVEARLNKNIDEARTRMQGKV